MCVQSRTATKCIFLSSVLQNSLGGRVLQMEYLTLNVLELVTLQIQILQSKREKITKFWLVRRNFVKSSLVSAQGQDCFMLTWQIYISLKCLEKKMLKKTGNKS